MKKLVRLWTRAFIVFLLVGASWFRSAHAELSDHVSLLIDTDKLELTVIVSGKTIRNYSVAVGKSETPTPVGEWQVIDKHIHWGRGFGTRWIGLNVPWGTYGIHGTNNPFSIGHNMSSGCVRMHNKDVEELYGMVKLGTPVLISGHPLRHFRRIAVGSIGADVWLVQSRLYHLGFYKGKVDGRFGKPTELALKRFERAYGLPVDGIVSNRDFRELGLEE